MNSLLRNRLAGSVAFISLVAAGAAQAAGVNVSDASIAGGKLVISGTASPNSWVRLDGQAGSAYNVKAGADGAFSLSVVYHPGDCVVELQNVVSPTTVGEASEALVANCGPAGLTARGAWSGKAAYAANDLVTSEGSTFRAKRANAGRKPAASADWEVFAAAGADGDGSRMTVKALTFHRPVRQAAICREPIRTRTSAPAGSAPRAGNPGVRPLTDFANNAVAGPNLRQPLDHPAKLAEQLALQSPFQRRLGAHRRGARRESDRRRSRPGLRGQL